MNIKSFILVRTLFALFADKAFQIIRAQTPYSSVRVLLSQHVRGEKRVERKKESSFEAAAEGAEAGPPRRRQARKAPRRSGHSEVRARDS